MRIALSFHPWIRGVSVDRHSGGGHDPLRVTHPHIINDLFILFLGGKITDHAGVFMSFHALASLIISLSSIGLGLFVYLNGRNKAANITLALYAASVAAWSFGQFMTEIVPDYGSALFWARFHLAGAIFIPVFFIHFVESFLNRRNNLVLASAYLLGSVIFATSFSPLFVASVSPKLGFRYFPDPGPAFLAYSAMFALLVLYGFYQLVRAYRASAGQAKNQIMWVLLASIIGFAGGSMMFLPVYNIRIYPVGYYLVPLYILIAIYAFMKHKLLDISIVIRKGLVYSILTLSITAVYVLLILFLKEAFQMVIGSSSLVAMPALVLALVLFLNPFKEKVQRSIDIVFFKSRYDYQKTLKMLSSAIREMTGLDEIISAVIDSIKGTVEEGKASLYILDKKNGSYVLRGGRGPAVLDAAGLKEFTADSTRIPMIVKNNAVGAMVLGEKLSGDSYADEEIDLLSTIGNQMAGSIENAMLYEDMMETQKHLYQADKLATLGTLAASLAHEIKNPIASVKGFAQVLPQAVENRDLEAIADFSSVVPKQLDRINELVEKLLKLSKPSKPELKDVAVNDVLDDVIKLIAKQCLKQGIKIVKEYDVDIIIHGDPNQLMQSFLNIAINAVQSMGKGGELKIKSQKENGKNIIEVTDAGTGISKDKIEHIFNPFYTTKEGGTGLGLSVTRKIIEDHKGKIEIDSEIGKGTRFRVIFQ